MGEPDQSSCESRDPQGLLYVEVDCPLDLEGELHAWYNTEHVPERMRIPGFASAHRYVALEGSPRWLASYELESVAVLDSPEYRKWLGPLQTPWTRRMVSLTQVHRFIFRLAWKAGSQSKAKPASPAGLLAIHCNPSAAAREEFSRWHDSEFCKELLQVSGVTRASRYDAIEGEGGLLLYEMEHPWIVQQPDFARLWSAAWMKPMESLPTYRRTLYMRIL
jgi:hypothetical protein